MAYIWFHHYASLSTVVDICYGAVTIQYCPCTLPVSLAEFGLNYDGPDAVNRNMRRVMRGLPVTTTSKPDMAILQNSTRTDIRIAPPDPPKPQLVLGDFKNGSNYSQDDTRAQCVMYLVALLYWLRVELGEPVEAVYGFYFCGQQCKGPDNTYTVGLIKLSAPTWLGE